MKFNDDSYFSNAYNAMVSGVDKQELLSLEMNFLKLIDFKLMVDPKTFERYYNHLVEISDSKAVLCNCSCLDPAHSDKVFTSLGKTGSENLAERNYRSGNKLLDDMNLKNVSHYEEHTDSRNPTKTSLSKVHTQANSIEASNSRHDSFSDSNKLMKQQLKAAASCLDHTQSVSATSSDRSRQHGLVSNNSSSTYPRSYDYTICEPQSVDHRVEKRQPDVPFRPAVKYPTCKIDNYHTHASLEMASHRVSF